MKLKLLSLFIVIFGIFQNGEAQKRNSTTTSTIQKVPENLHNGINTVNGAINGIIETIASTIGGTIDTITLQLANLPNLVAPLVEPIPIAGSLVQKVNKKLNLCERVTGELFAKKVVLYGSQCFTKQIDKIGKDFNDIIFDIEKILDHGGKLWKKLSKESILEAPVEFLTFATGEVTTIVNLVLNIGKPAEIFTLAVPEIGICFGVEIMKVVVEASGDLVKFAQCEFEPLQIF